MSDELCAKNDIRISVHRSELNVQLFAHCDLVDGLIKHLVRTRPNGTKAEGQRMVAAPGRGVAGFVEESVTVTCSWSIRRVNGCPTFT